MCLFYMVGLGEAQGIRLRVQALGTDHQVQIPALPRTSWATLGEFLTTFLS